MSSDYTHDDPGPIPDDRRDETYEVIKEYEVAAIGPSRGEEYDWLQGEWGGEPSFPSSQIIRPIGVASVKLCFLPRTVRILQKVFNEMRFRLNLSRQPRNELEQLDRVLHGAGEGAQAAMETLVKGISFSRTFGHRHIAIEMAPSLDNPSLKKTLRCIPSGEHDKKFSDAVDSLEAASCTAERGRVSDGFGIIDRRTVSYEYLPNALVDGVFACFQPKLDPAFLERSPGEVRRELRKILIDTCAVRLDVHYDCIVGPRDDFYDASKVVTRRIAFADGYPDEIKWALAQCAVHLTAQPGSQLIEGDALDVGRLARLTGPEVDDALAGCFPAEMRSNVVDARERFRRGLHAAELPDKEELMRRLQTVRFRGAFPRIAELRAKA